jgi:hypothetical protein
MAKIVDDIIVVKLSKLVKDKDDSNVHLVDNSLREQIEDAIQDIVDPATVVEVDLK